MRGINNLVLGFEKCFFNSSLTFIKRSSTSPVLSHLTSVYDTRSEYSVATYRLLGKPMLQSFGADLMEFTISVTASKTCKWKNFSAQNFQVYFYVVFTVHLDITFLFFKTNECTILFSYLYI